MRPGGAMAAWRPFPGGVRAGYTNRAGGRGGRFMPALPPVRFVYPARILPGKGQHAAIDALGRMRPDQRYRAHLTLVGAVADRIYADQLRIQAYNQPVTFAYDVPDIVPYYQDAEVVLFPTLM